mmetsp:Transcript_17539/g.45160  ORF Transcript_17539/g.45160 Transcript_17539/m.45160 type:complete len:207 (-) Transcript_17539:1435-2055(-)
MAFRMTMRLGVTSTFSSSRMYVRACSSFFSCGGEKPPAERYPSCFRAMFVSMSVTSPFSPKIMPGYTSTPSPMKSVPSLAALERSTAVAVPGALAMRTPFLSRGAGGPCGRISRNSETAVAVPPVNSRSHERMPRREAVATSNLRVCLPFASEAMSSTFAPRTAIRSMTALLWSLPTSIWISSQGSNKTPSSFLCLTTEGGDSDIS